jgi:cyclic pyranopterin phosphate synthase
MAEDMTFLPKREVLSLEELERVAIAFINRGVTKIRVTGGEPLVRRDIMRLFERLSERLHEGGLEELTLTTNGTQLAKYAHQLHSLGVKRVNISLDTLDDGVFQKLTRRRALGQTLAGVEAAQGAGLRVKINTVALKGVNEAEIPSIISWAHGRGMDLTLIEVMPLGDIDEDRFDQYLPLSTVRKELERHWTLTPLDYKTGGPARYVRVEETNGRLGLITP